jgi:hypothetical protein
MRESARHRRRRAARRRHAAGGRMKEPEPKRSERWRQRHGDRQIVTPAEAGEALAEWFADMQETVERLNERDRWKELAEEARRQRDLSHYKHRRV